VITVLIVDDHQLVRQGLRRMLEEDSDLRVVAEAANGKEALAEIDRTSPDIVLLDISMPEMDGLEMMARMGKSESRQVKVVVLTMYDDEHYAARLLRMGAKAYVTKDAAPTDLVKAIKTVHSGGRFISDVLRDAMAARFIEGAPSDPLEACSDREFQVLRCLASGMTNREIAAEIKISTKTVDAHRLNLLAKLGLRNNSELTQFAIRHGVLKVTVQKPNNSSQGTSDPD